VECPERTGVGEEEGRRGVGTEGASVSPSMLVMSPPRVSPVSESAGAPHPLQKRAFGDSLAPHCGQNM